ncbi:MAG: ABC transporter substrate-binding protein [Christensenellaceae bacterium]|nr:ABC transporter substrate-binding protein [Christensenellaceae bacterium]
MSKIFKTTIITAAVILLIIGAFGCKSVSSVDIPNNTNTKNETELMPLSDKENCLTAAYTDFNGVFSPFYANSPSDKDVVSLVTTDLFSLDRAGNVVTHAKKGETVNFNGTDYNYSGIADLTVTQKENGTAEYNIELRSDIVFSDGTPLTADDVIFTMYVLCDPTYDGPIEFSALPIKGLSDYRSGTQSLYYLMMEAGRENTDFTYWTKEVQDSFFADLDKAGEAFARQIVDYCAAAGYCLKGDIPAAAKSWGFNGLKAGSTHLDFFNLMCEEYSWDLDELSRVESAGSSLFELMDNSEVYLKGIVTDNSVLNISGIKKTGTFSLKVTLTQSDISLLRKFCIPVAPLHYYGDKELYDYDRCSFGFNKGDLTSIKNNNKPMGAGPYIFCGYENGTAAFKANENYFKGCPKTAYINLIKTPESDKVPSVIDGQADISTPSFTKETEQQLLSYGDSLSGDILTAVTISEPGYAYIGMNAKVLSVNNDPYSESSINLRKAFGTVFAAYRKTAVENYYSKRAQVIGSVPLYSSSALAQPTETISDEQMINTALKHFEAAGFIAENNVITAAPSGASLGYDIWIPAGGKGDHPLYELCTLSSEALKTIGIELRIKDIETSNELWNALNSNEAAMWAGTWGETVPADMYQIYFSGSGTEQPGGYNYMFDVHDAMLNDLIIAARTTYDKAERTKLYSQCLDIIESWNVEIPMYQRLNIMILSTERVEIASVPKDMTAHYGLINEIEKLALR